MNSMIPVTLLTGFLGAGKTTLLNRILTERHGEKIAVIENEFGEANIDSDLLLQGEEQIVEMNNGCICCTVRGDLVRILGELAAKRDQGRLAFDRVIIETTGLADPGPVVQTFFVEPDIAERYLIDAIITVVDAKHAMRQLDEHAAAQEQVGFADRILISKTDLVDADQLDALKSRLVRMNRRATIRNVDFGAAPLDQLIDIRGFNLDAVIEADPGFLDNHHHHHHDAIASFVVEADRPYDGAELNDFLSAIINVYGNDLLRYKGTLALDDLPHRICFQGVHMLMGGTPGKPWQPGEPRKSTMVFIGRNLPRDVIERGMRNALLSTEKSYEHGLT